MHFDDQPRFKPSDISPLSPASSAAERTSLEGVHFFRPTGTDTLHYHGSDVVEMQGFLEKRGIQAQRKDPDPALTFDVGKPHLEIAGSAALTKVASLGGKFTGASESLEAVQL